MCLNVFKGHPWNFKVTRDKGIADFEFTDGFEMMDKAWRSRDEMLYCFRKSSVKFQGHGGQKKSPILSRIERFRTVTPIWIYRWILNYAQSL